MKSKAMLLLWPLAAFAFCRPPEPPPLNSEALAR